MLGIKESLSQGATAERMERSPYGANYFTMEGMNHIHNLHIFQLGQVSGAHFPFWIVFVEIPLNLDA